MNSFNAVSRDELAQRYIEQLPYQLYPFQEDALLAWFSAEQGVLVCAPTGMGKTLIAEAALFEALHTGTCAYYTTPLIALTEQKFREMQALAVRWGFSAKDVGLVTGNRRENPQAAVLVVVAEILANRLLHAELFDFDQVAAVVMDEFHSFADPERGMVWELTLALLPSHVRTLLLSATVGNAEEFVQWLRTSHNRRLELVRGYERKVPLVFQWVGDRLLIEQLEEMAQGDEQSRKTPALVFCFNREECWAVAEQIKGKRLLADGQQARLAAALKRYDFSHGAGAMLRQLLLRGVGVHHAGVLPKYRRIVEELFQQKLLSVVVCTETLSAGINLPARSVVLPQLVKGPPGKMKLLDPSSAHQMFGRAGRPQFDNQGYVFVLAHEDDVKIARWKQKYEQVPEDTKDPALLRLKKELKRKMPKRRENQQYWTEAQFEKLRLAPPGKLVSRGPLPWRLLAYMLDASPEVDRVRQLVSRRLTDSKHIAAAQGELERMLLVLWRAGYVTLEPEPPRVAELVPSEPAQRAASPEPSRGKQLFRATFSSIDEAEEAVKAFFEETCGDQPPASAPQYRPVLARPTRDLQKLMLFRGINPLYAVFLINQLGIADRNELVQALESVLEIPGSVAYHLRVPLPDQLPPGPLATQRLDEQLLRLGLATEDELVPPPREERYRRQATFEDARPRVLTLAEKLRRLFDYDFPGVHDVRTQPVWAAGEVLQFAGDFNKYITSRGLQKQEGVIFRHLLRLILLLAEFQQLCPPDLTEDQWCGQLRDIADRLTDCCRRVDPLSTDEALQQAAIDA